MKTFLILTTALLGLLVIVFTDKPAPKGPGYTLRVTFAGLAHPDTVLDIAKQIIERYPIQQPVAQVTLDGEL
jgi:hypothetical protein